MTGFQPYEQDTQTADPISIGPCDERGLAQGQRPFVGNNPHPNVVPRHELVQPARDIFLDDVERQDFLMQVLTIETRATFLEFESLLAFGSRGWQRIPTAHGQPLGDPFQTHDSS